MNKVICNREADSNVFVRIDRRKKEGIKTKYQFRDIDGREYNIYISPRKKAYIVKTTKSGREYNITLPDDVSKQILAETEQVKPNVIPQ